MIKYFKIFYVGILECDPTKPIVNYVKNEIKEINLLKSFVIRKGNIMNQSMLS